MNKRLTVLDMQKKIDANKKLKGITVIRVGRRNNLSYITVDNKCGHRETKQTHNVLNNVGCKHCMILTHDKIKEVLNKKYQNLLVLNKFIVKDDESMCYITWTYCGHSETRYLKILKRNAVCNECKKISWFND